MVADQCLELGNERRAAPKGEVRFDPMLERTQTQFLQSGDLVAGEILVREVGQRVAAPERQPIPEAGRSSAGVTTLQRFMTLPGQALEGVDVDSVRTDLERVPAAAGDEDAVAECLPKPRDVDL